MRSSCFVAAISAHTSGLGPRSRVGLGWERGAVVYLPHPSPQREQGNEGGGPFHAERSCRFRYVPLMPTAACSCEAETVIARAKPAMKRAEPEGAHATIEKSPSWNQSAAKGNFSRYALAS